MRKKAFKGHRGEVVYLRHASKALKGNALKDPYVRDIGIYLPPGYEDEPKRRYPLFMDMVGFTGSGHSHLNWQAFEENLPERLDRLIAERKMGPVICVFPDCFTSLGGNQYINSSAMGRYEDYLIDEVIPAVEQVFRVFPNRTKRACFGKSSGGYGALIHGMRRADTWGAIACHSGDMYFDLVYRNDFPNVCNLMAKHNYDIKRFLKDFEAKKKPSGDDVHTLMAIAMAATYDPDPKAPLGFHFPVNLRTCEVDETRWRRWLKHDPICLVDKYAKNLRKLKLLYIDCGTKDQYHLHFGARVMSRLLTEKKIKHVHEEFDDNHSGINYRMDRSLPMLYKALMGKQA